MAALVQKVELEQAAEEMDIEVTDEDVDKRLEEIVKQYYGGDQKQLDKQLKAAEADARPGARGPSRAARLGEDLQPA